MMTSLTIVTINTGKGDGAYQRRIALLSKELDLLKPDVVLLQETLAAPGIHAHTADTLAERLSLNVAFAPARRKVREVEGKRLLSDSGLAILTREPLDATATITLPADPADGERIALLATLRINDITCLIANVHLTHLRDNDGLRRSQLATLLADPSLSQPHHVRLIGGDLNTPLDRLPSLFGSSPSWTWHDSWEVACGPHARATVPVGTAPEDGRCIDYILSIAPAGQSHPRFRDARVVLDQPDDDGAYPSDHCGVLVQMDLDGSVGASS